MLPNIADDLHREICIVIDDSLNLLGVFLDEGEPGVDLGQSLVTQGVRFGDVGGDIGVGLG